MKKLIIIGSSGFGREVAWLVERINLCSPEWDLLGFLDDDTSKIGAVVNGYSVLGSTACVNKYKDAFFVCAIGSSKGRKKVTEKILRENKEIKFATLIDPSVIKSDAIDIGEGSIVCAGTIMTVNIRIGKHVIINLDCTVGHDAVLKDFVTVYPGVHISGNANVGEVTELGTGSQLIQGVIVGENTLVGAGATVINEIPKSCTAVGVPAKPVKFHSEGNDNA